MNSTGERLKGFDVLDIPGFSNNFKWLSNLNNLVFQMAVKSDNFFQMALIKKIFFVFKLK